MEFLGIAGRRIKKLNAKDVVGIRFHVLKAQVFAAITP